MKCFFDFHPLHSKHKLLDVTIPGIIFTLLEDEIFQKMYNYAWWLVSESPSTNIFDEIQFQLQLLHWHIYLMIFWDSAHIIKSDFSDQ
jgi:hypothetical protein